MLSTLGLIPVDIPTQYVSLVSRVPEIKTARLELAVLTAAELFAVLHDEREDVPFTWPPWWPDVVDRHHVEVWLERSHAPSREEWAPRAVVNPANRSMVGHAGFHLPPCPLAEALSDTTFEGYATPAGGVVEIGYTVFPDARGQGFATETVAALVSWAFATHEVTTVLATVAKDNEASHRVLARVGGFRIIGTCRGDDGTVQDVYRRDQHD